jgi:hypothetical protein
MNEKEKKSFLRTLQRKNSRSGVKYAFPADFDSFAKKVYREGYPQWGSENASGGGCQPLDIEGVKNICQGFMTNNFFSSEKNINILWVCMLVVAKNIVNNYFFMSIIILQQFILGGLWIL